MVPNDGAANGNQLFRPEGNPNSFLLPKKFEPIDIGGYFPAVSNSFTFPITAKASDT